MSTWQRMMVGSLIIIADAVSAIVYYRVFRPTLYPLATDDFEGPMSTAVETADALVPTLLLVILFATMVWILVGGLQKERTRDVVRRR